MLFRFYKYMRLGENKMKRRGKLLLGLSLAGIMALNLTGCGSSEPNKQV